MYRAAIQNNKTARAIIPFPFRSRSRPLFFLPTGCLSLCISEAYECLGFGVSIRDKDYVGAAMERARRFDPVGATTSCQSLRRRLHPAGHDGDAFSSAISLPLVRYALRVRLSSHPKDASPAASSRGVQFLAARTAEPAISKSPAHASDLLHVLWRGGSS